MDMSKFGKTKREPSSDARQGARAVHEMYVSLIDDGMDSDVAVKIIGEMLYNASRES